MQLQVAPSLLSADFLHLSKDVEMLNSNADIIHLDVMDGTFVPNISFGFSVVEPVCREARIPTDAHLMVVQPWKWFDRLAKCGTSMVSFHLEAAGDRTEECLASLRSMGVKAGLAINPDIEVEDLFPYVGKADFFLIMSVFAGFGGQKFIEGSLSRVAALKAEIEKSGDKALIEVDGGVNADNAPLLKEAGADILVAGSAVFRASDPASAIRQIREA